MLRRFISILLAGIMILSLAGCGAKTQSENPPVETDAPLVSEENNEDLAVVEDSQGASDTDVLTDEDLAALAEKGDMTEIDSMITTVEDALRLIVIAGITVRSTGSSVASITQKVMHHEVLIKMICNMLTYDYEELGMVSIPSDHYFYLYAKQDDVYWMYDVLLAANGGPIDGKAFDSSEEMLEYAVKLRKSDKGSISTLFLLTPNTPEEKLAIYLTTPQYTKEQISQWAAEGLTLEQWAEKIKVPADAIQMLNALGYRSMLANDNVPFWGPDGTEWSGIWNAQTVFNHRTGNCGGTSTIINTLLADDFDQQGYIEFTSNGGGHIFNYFVLDGIYAMCDFVNLFGYNEDIYIKYIGSNPHAFGEQYLTDPRYTDPNGEDYIYHLFMYPRDGAVKLPKGNDDSSEKTEFNVLWDILPAQYQDLYTVLFEREGHPIRYATISDISTWPEEAR